MVDDDRTASSSRRSASSELSSCRGGQCVGTSTAVGSVINENAMIYRPGKTVGDVILSAGLTEDAEVKESFVLRADGSILSRRGGGLFSNFDSLKLMPGDTLVVPPKVDRESSYNFVIRALRDWTQIFSNLGLGAVAIKTLRN